MKEKKWTKLWKFSWKYKIAISIYPNSDPKKPFDELSFFSASAINCNAFCSLSAMIIHVKLNFFLWNSFDEKNIDFS